LLQVRRHYLIRFRKIIEQGIGDESKSSSNIINNNSSSSAIMILSESVPLSLVPTSSSDHTTERLTGSVDDLD
jgi:ERCC4-type nuclease